MIFNLRINHKLFPVDVFGSNQQGIITNDSLELVDSVTQNHYSNNLKDSLIFWQNLKISGVKRNISVVNNLNLISKSTRIHDFTLTDTLNLSQPIPPPIYDHLNFIEIVIIIKGLPPVLNVIRFSDFVSYNRKLDLSVTNTLSLKSFPMGWNIPFKGRPTNT